jgi:4-hydroxy-tetrahydrodipicolinate synthase
MGWQGVANIMVTPFTLDEEVDVDSIGRVTRWAMEKGVDAVVPLGIMGEAHKLTDDERDTVLEAVVRSTEGQIPVVAGCTVLFLGGAIIAYDPSRGLMNRKQDAGGNA